MVDHFLVEIQAIAIADSSDINEDNQGVSMVNPCFSVNYSSHNY